MVAPVSPRNRFNSYTDGFGKVWWRTNQYGFAQARPIDRPLQYSTTRWKLTNLQTSIGGVNIGDADSLSHPPLSIYGNALTSVANRAYEKLRGEVANAQIGVNVVEYKQARNMFASRGKDLLGLLFLLARGKFATAGRALGCTFYNGKPPRRNRSGWALPDQARKTNISLSNLWLEWHFGLSPMISDVQAAGKVLTDPIPNVWIKGRAQEFVKHKKRSDDLANPGTYTEEIWETRVRFMQMTGIAITNPNLALANQLGLLNPAALLWEIVPFSFVLDWFVNVGDWLQGFTDFAGMTLRDPLRAQHVWSWHTYVRVAKPVGGTHWNGLRKGSIVNLDRVLGLSGPTLRVRPLKLPSLSRVATTWSLISQIAQRHR
jgi:hypothetical protein